MASPGVPGEGGFLLVDANWFPSARALAKGDPVFGAMARELRRRCDELLDAESPKRLEPERLDSPWWKTRMGAKQLVVAVWDLATATHFYEDERYSDLALRVLRTLAAHNMAENCDGTCYGRPYRSWLATSLDAGHAAESLGVALDLLRPFMDADEARGIGAYLSRFIEALKRHHEASGDDDCADLDNKPMIGRFGLGVLASALERVGTGPDEEALRISRHACLRYLEAGHDQGLLAEGPMYGFACLKHIAVTGTTLIRRGDEAVWRSAAWDEIVTAYASQVIPCDGTINMMNDCYPVRLTSWLLAVARYRRNGLARWLWEQIVQPLGAGRWDAPVSWNHIHAPWWNGLLPHAMIAYDPDVAPCAPERSGVRKTRCFDIRGVVDQRGGWEEDDWFLTVTCCPDIRWRSRRGIPHNNADRGHFSFSALGEKFFIDNGYGNVTLSGSTEVIRFGGTGQAHSVPELDGGMQLKRVLTSGLSDVRLDTWASMVKMDFHEAYASCSLARRTVLVVPRPGRATPYLVIHDRVDTPHKAYHTFGLLFQVDPDAEVRAIDRETVDIVGGRHGNRCRLVTTSPRPGRFSVDEFLGHPRLRFQCQGYAFNALTVVVPWRQGEAPPVFRRSDPDHDAGFVARFRFDGIEDALCLCSGARLAMEGIETDACFALLRDGAPEQIAVVEGTWVRRDGRSLFTAPNRTDYVGLALREEAGDGTEGTS